MNSHTLTLAAPSSLVVGAARLDGKNLRIRDRAQPPPRPLAKRHSGLVHSLHDWVIRAYVGIATNDGQNDCGGDLSMTSADAEVLEEALFDTRDQLRNDSPRFGSFLPDSMEHGWLFGDRFYTESLAGTSLVDWFTGVIEGEPAQHLAP